MELSFFGETAAFHHIGLAVQDAAKAGIVDLTMTVDPIQHVRVGFVSISGCCVELIEPLEEGSPITTNIIQGHKLVHICFEVDDLEVSLREAERHDFRVIQNPVPASAFGQRHIAWLWHPVWGVFELLER